MSKNYGYSTHTMPARIPSSTISNKKTHFIYIFFAIMPSIRYMTLCVLLAAIIQSAYASWSLKSISLEVLGRNHQLQDTFSIGEKQDAADQSNKLPTISPKDSALTKSIRISEVSTLKLQFKIVDDDSNKPVFPHQMFVRFIRKSDQKESVIVAISTKDTMTATIILKKDLKSEFWVHEDYYSLDLIMGDVSMSSPLIFPLLSAEYGVQMVFIDAPTPKPTPGVFDFDLSVKKYLLPEFTFQLKPEHKQPPSVISLAFTALVLIPALIMIVGFGKLGALNLKFPEGLNALFFVGFQICIFAQVSYLVLFWLGWNIIKTWKFQAVTMIPTCFFAYHTLKYVAQRDSPKEKEKSQ